MAELIITKENYKSEVLQSDKPVLLDFWATWCGPCQMLAPVIAEIAAEYDGRVKVGKVNVDEQPELANAFSISSIPTLVVLRDGGVTGTSVGYVPKEKITAMLS